MLRSHFRLSVGYSLLYSVLSILLLFLTLIITYPQAAQVGDTASDRVRYLMKASNKESGINRYILALKLASFGKPAIKPLVKLLKDPNVKIRVTAAAALGEIGDPEAVEPLIAALHDKDPLVRREAAESLGLIKDPRVVEPLIKAISDLDERTASEAVEALGRTGDPRAVEPLIAALKDDCEPVRYTAVDALKKFKDVRAVTPLINLMSSSDRYSSRDVLASVVAVGKPAAELLKAALQHDDENVRRGAALALGLLKDPAAIEPLVELAKQDGIGCPGQEWYVLAYMKERSFESLIKLLKTQPPAPEKPLVQMNETEKEHYEGMKIDAENIREKAAEMLGRVDDKRAVEPLIEALSDEDSSVRKSAAESLGLLKDKRAVEPLIRTLKDEDEWTRERAMEALGLLKDKRAVEPLLPFLEKRDGDKLGSESGYAAEALAEIGDRRAVTPMLKAFKRKDGQKNNLLIYALGTLGDPRATGPLVSLLDKPGDQQLAALIALADLKDPKAIPSVIRFIKTTQWESNDPGAYSSTNRCVMSCTADVLSSTGKPAIKPTIALLSSKKWQVRMTAAIALAEMKYPEAEHVLMKALSKGDLQVIAGARKFYIRKAIRGTEPILIRALSKYGNPEIAADYYVCGNRRLEKSVWLHGLGKHGYCFLCMKGIGTETWGKPTRVKEED